MRGVKETGQEDEFAACVHETSCCADEGSEAEEFKGVEEGA